MKTCLQSLWAVTVILLWNCIRMPLPDMRSFSDGTLCINVLNAVGTDDADADPSAFDNVAVTAVSMSYVQVHYFDF